MKRLIFVAALLLGTASAHTAVTHIAPASFATVAAPQTVELTFSEPIDLHFSAFKVYPLPASGDHAALTRAATDLGKAKIGAGDDPLRADTAPKLTGMAAKLSLPLRPHLKAGNYAVIWRILSEDGHIVTGQSVFTVK